tara:strand:+ start:3978 stop:4235 length:258 start_codon:yes stop_codon:yes gene_type:complete
MKIEMVPVNGIWTRALVVDENTPHVPCENCGKPVYSHPLLIKNDGDWCIFCDDEYHRSDMTEKELGMWTMKQMADGKAVIVVREM